MAKSKPRQRNAKHNAWKMIEKCWGNGDQEIRILRNTDNADDCAVTGVYSDGIPIWKVTKKVGPGLEVGLVLMSIKEG